MKRFALAVVIATSLLGCAGAPPAKVQSAVDTYLRGDCKELFLKTGFPNYQHVAQVFVSGKAVFALADDGQGQQKCGMARNGFDIKTDPLFGNTGWEQLEAVAVANCELAKSSVKAPCKVFARNNDVVWKQGAKIDFQ